MNDGLLPPVPSLNDAFRQALQRRLQGFEARALPVQGRKRAAVALPVVAEGLGARVQGLHAPSAWSDAAALLLTKRHAGMRAHAGQWALPGGRMDEGETAEQTALRELAEEVGLHLPPQAVLGRLDDYATRSGYVITPVVVWGGQAETLQPSAEEVAAIHRVRMAEWLRSDAPILNQVKGSEHPVLRMPVGEQWIAAPTAAFLYQFREVCLGDRTTRVAHFDQPFFAWR